MDWRKIGENIVDKYTSFKRIINLPIYLSDPQDIIVRTLSGQIIPKPES